MEFDRNSQSKKGLISILFVRSKITPIQGLRSSFFSSHFKRVFQSVGGNFRSNSPTWQFAGKLFQRNVKSSLMIGRAKNYSFISETYPSNHEADETICW